MGLGVAPRHEAWFVDTSVPPDESGDRDSGGSPSRGNSRPLLRGAVLRIFAGRAEVGDQPGTAPHFREWREDCVLDVTARQSPPGVLSQAGSPIHPIHRLAKEPLMLLRQCKL